MPKYPHDREHHYDLPLSVIPPAADKSVLSDTDDSVSHGKKEGCSGNPTNTTCPINKVYAALDPGIADYSSLDCSVVVYEIQQALETIDDPQQRAAMVAQLHSCPSCDELMEMEDKLRALVYNACLEKAPDSLRKKLQGLVSAAGKDPSPSVSSFSEETDSSEKMDIVS